MTGNRVLVVLIHGIWMQGPFMRVLGQMLQKHGWRTQALSYDFLNSTPAENADALAAKIEAFDVDTVHVVAHSLGGIVTLHMLHRHPALKVGKVVLLGSPVRGSRVAREVHHNRLLRLLLGKSVEQGLLGGAPAWRGDRPLGVITGSGKFGLTSFLYGSGEDSDGVVAASEAMLDNATDRVTVARSHSALLISSQCADFVSRFLATDSFGTVRERSAPL